MIYGKFLRLSFFSSYIVFFDRQEEFAVQETIDHWKPIHEKMIQKLTLTRNRVEAYLNLS
jgi:hypothetical protein